MKTSKKLLNLFVALAIYIVSLPIVCLELSLRAVTKTHDALIKMLPEGISNALDNFTC